jgi:hypothetical protein
MGMGGWAAVMIWIAGLAAAGWAIDRALIACELRGWIVYRLTPRPRHEMRRAAGSVLIGVDGLFRPAARHVATVVREAAVHRDSDEGAERRTPDAASAAPSDRAVTTAPLD